MNKRVLIITALIITGIIAIGFYMSKTNDEEKDSISSQPTTEKQKSDNITEVDEKAWKDITKLKIPEGEKSDYPTNAKDWIATEYSVFNEISVQDSKMQQAGYGEYYKYYLEAIGIPTALSIIQVKGISIEKDFNNIQQLAAIIVEGHNKRTENVDPDRPETFSSWEAPSESLIQASDYLKQLFNDLNAAINKEGSGELFGVAYQVDGNKTKELEAFIQGNY